MNRTQIKHRHPEQGLDEIFLGNAVLKDVQDSSWRSSRLGRTAYMLNGTEIKRQDSQFRFNDLMPWFIKKEEVEGAIKFETFMQGAGWRDTVAVYQSMLDEAKGGVKLPKRLYKNENVHFIFQDENGKILMDDPKLFWDATCTEYPSERETYSFRPTDSGKCAFWATNYEIVKVETNA